MIPHRHSRPADDSPESLCLGAVPQQGADDAPTLGCVGKGRLQSSRQGLGESIGQAGCPRGSCCQHPDTLSTPNVGWNPKLSDREALVQGIWVGRPPGTQSWGAMSPKICRSLDKENTLLDSPIYSSETKSLRTESYSFFPPVSFVHTHLAAKSDLN